MAHESYWGTHVTSEKSFLWVYWKAMPNRQLSYWASHVSAVSSILVRFCVTGSRCRIGVKVRLEGTLIHDGVVIPVSLCYWITSCLKVIEFKWICLQVSVRLLQTAAQSMSNYHYHSEEWFSQNFYMTGSHNPWNL